MIAITGFVRKTGLILMALLSGSLLFNGEAASRSESDFLFKNIGIEDGLSARRVYAVEQDKEGYMWFGTEDGLNCYDGYEIRIFRNDRKQASSLSDSKVNCLLCDRKGRLWVGTDRGLNLYCPSDGTFTIPAFSQDKTGMLAEAIVRCLYEDNDGNIWAGTMGGLVRMNPEKDELQCHSFKGIDGSNNRNIIRSILEDSSGRIWIGTFDGLFRMDVLTGEIHLVNVREIRPMVPENNLILSLMLDPADERILWVGSETGLYRLDTEKGSFTAYTKEDQPSALSNNVIKCMQTSGLDHIIAGTDAGLDLFDKRTGTSRIFYHDIFQKTTIANDVVWDIVRDAAGHYWFATDNGVSQVVYSGLDLKNHKVDKPEPGRPTPDNRVVDIAFDRQGGKYISLDDRVFYEDASGQRTYYNFSHYSDIKIKRLLVDQAGTVWAGTSNSLWYKDVGSSDFQRIASRNLRYVNSLIEDQQGNIWVESVTGSCRIKVEREAQGKIADLDFTWFSLGDGTLRSVKSSEFHVDADNRIWFMTKDLCLHVFSDNGQELQKYRMDDPASGLEGSVIYSYVETSSLYILTDRGIFRHEPEQDHFVPARLPSSCGQELSSLVKDRYDNLWATSGSRLVRSDAVDRSILFFDLSAYLDNKVLLPNSLHVSPEGEIWIGSYNEYFHFEPKPHYEVGEKMEVRFTDFKVFGNSREWEKRTGRSPRIVLGYEENSIKVCYSILDYQYPQNVQYATKLEGLDKQWKVTTGENHVAYSHLAPGHYVLRVKAGYSDQSWISEAAMEIVVRHPWWSSTGAIIIYGLLLCGFAYFLWRMARTSLRLREKVRIEGVRRQAQEDLLQYKVRFFTNISHELKTPLALILGPMEAMMEDATEPEQQKKLEIMHGNASRLLKMVNQIMDFNKLEKGTIRVQPIEGELVGFLRKIYDMFRSEAKNRNITYNFLSEWKSYVTAFDDDKVEKVVYNLLSNAFKYTLDWGNINVRLGKCVLQGKEAVEIRVEDNGVGIPEEDREKIFRRFYQSRNGDGNRAGTGIGLSLAKDFVDMMGGTIIASSGAEGGSVFTVCLPLEMKNYAEADVVENLETGEEGRCILVVDDNQEMCSFMQMSLEKEYKVIIAHDGEEGLRKVRKYDPDIIISDLMMPVMDGLEFCRRIKEDESVNHIPFILLTAKDGDENVYTGLQTGADAYISKPFNMKLLKLRLENLYETRKNMQTYLRSRLKYGESAADQESKETFHDPFVDKVVSTIKDNMADDSLDVAALSEVMKLPKQQLYRKIKALTGMTVVELIRSVRLEEAAMRLRGGTETISEIMYSVGFSNNSYFSKCFAEQYKLSPSEYRKQTEKQ